MITANEIQFGDCRDIMDGWILEGRGGTVQTCVTSPPYFGLRDYGVSGQIGLEKTPDEYVAGLVDVFRRVRDLLRDDGTLWLNLGDSYAGSGKGRNADGTHQLGGKQGTNTGTVIGRLVKTAAPDCKSKDLIGIPWRVAFALQADGWYLRQDIIWAKPNPMPESVRDRCTKSHEYIFLLSKSPNYFFDSEAIKEPSVSYDPNWKKEKTGNNIIGNMSTRGVTRTTEGLNLKPAWEKTHQTRNRRDVWNISAKPYKGAHFATFPPDLIEPCILAGSRSQDIVLDPFIGSGTTAQVAVKHGRQYLGCELNPAYKELIDKRLAK